MHTYTQQTTYLQKKFECTYRTLYENGVLEFVMKDNFGQQQGKQGVCRWKKKKNKNIDLSKVVGVSASEEKAIWRKL